MSNRIILVFLLLGLSSASAFGQTPNDCINAVSICGNQDLNFNSFGPGVQDFQQPGNVAPSCLFTENQSLWLKIPIQTDGLLAFDIIPESDDDDFDFALFGPNVDCNNLGPSIRCSYHDPFLWPSARTGVRIGEMDTSESESSGNGFVKEVEVKAGEFYYLMVDNFSLSNSGFDFLYTGTAAIGESFDINTPIFPLICDNEEDNLEPYDLSLLDDEITGGNPNLEVTYHLTEEDAILRRNALPAIYDVQEGGQIFARATSTATGCYQFTSFTTRLSFPDSDVTIEGESTICVGSIGVPYRAASDVRSHDYEWFIQGGDITYGVSPEDITVDWNDLGPDSFLKVLPITDKGCFRDTIRLDITPITELVAPELQGPQTICQGEEGSSTYIAPSADGATYYWSVENGMIIGPDDQSTVRVQWDGNQTGTIGYSVENPANGNCLEVSPLLEVNFNPEIEVDFVANDPTCFNTPTGSISLSATGGSGTLNVLWEDGATALERTSLMAGTYNYIITDENDCQTTGSISLAQPDEFLISASNQANLSCFGDKSGFAEVVLQGGTAPFQYQWTYNGNSLAINGPVLNNQPAGDYTVVVTDARGCTVTESFQITEPSKLQADLDQLINLPICPQASDGEVTVGAKGGTTDYEFIWQLNPQPTGATACGLSRGSYKVQIIDANGCQTSQEVEVTEQFPRVYIPNAFTPNGDGDNETFAALANCPLDSFQMQIFNQWGSPVFASVGIKSEWDGRFEGEPVPVGTYAYRVSYSFQVNGKQFTETIGGQIRLIR